MKTRNIIWGLVLVLIGVLFILKNVGVIYFTWYSLWKLWPVVLVLIGVAILPIKEVFKVILTIIVLVVAAIILASSPGFRTSDPKWSFKGDWEKRDSKEPLIADQRLFESFDEMIAEAELVFDAAAGTFTLHETSEELFEFEREGNIGKYNYATTDLGERREIRIDMAEGRIRRIDLKNKVAIKLNPNPLWDLKIGVGAASIDMDLSKFRIRDLKIDGGASSISLKLGDLHDDCRLKISSGASSIKIKVPEEFACEVRLNTVLSSKELKGFDKLGDGTYVTPGFSESASNILIQIDAAVSSLQVDRY